MNDSLVAWLVSALCLAVMSLLACRWISHIRQRRAELRRAHGYSLIHSLRAYSAWIECQRDLPFTAQSLDELTSPAPLHRAREIRREWFPSLGQQMVQLLQAHSRLIEYLWEQNLLRLTQGTSWKPAYLDPQYQQLRGSQEDLIDEMMASCRQLIGETGSWRGTGSDFVFSNTAAPQDPVGRV